MTNVSCSGNNYKEAHSGSQPYINYNVSSINEYDKAVDLNDRSKLFLSHALPICNDLAGDGKLGYRFTSADELEEIDIGPEDKPRPTFITLLKEYSDCFAWDFMEMPGLDRSIIEHRLPLKKGF
jgi:hypothetical protein